MEFEAEIRRKVQPGDLLYQTDETGTSPYHVPWEDGVHVVVMTYYFLGKVSEDIT